MGTVKSAAIPVAPNNTSFGTPRAVSLDGRSLGPHHGAAHTQTDLGQKQDPAKVIICAPTPFMFPRCLMPGLRPVSVKGHPSSAPRRSDPPLTELAPLSPRGRGAGLPAPQF